MKRNDPALPKALDGYCKAREAGMGEKEARAKFDLDHVKADFAWAAYKGNTKSYVAPIQGWAAMSATAQDAQIVALRAKGMSWGRIAVATGYHPVPAQCGTGSLTEAEVSKRFSLAAGIAREGTRTGKGGRWLANDQALYVGRHKGVGVEAPKPLAVDRAELAKGADEYESVLPKIAKRVAAKRVAKRTAK